MTRPLRWLVPLAMSVTACHSAAVDPEQVPSSPDAPLDGASSAVASVACDPLAVHPTTLTTIRGVGKDASGTLYVMDSPPSPRSPRVFVTADSELQRQHVLGAGISGGTDYTLSFDAPGSDASNAKALLVDLSSAAATATATSMALGPADSKSFLGGPGETPLTVVNASAVTGLNVRDLPGVVVAVLDVTGGDAIVITSPGDNESDTDFRLFYGTPGAMVERTIVSYEEGDGFPAITFLDGAAQARIDVSTVSGGDADPFGEPGPGTLVVGGASQSLTVRMPTPTALSGFSFVCFAP